MIIDIHAHTFPQKIAAHALESLSKTSHMGPSTDGTREGLISSMSKAGVDKSVALSVATKASQVESINNLAISFAGEDGPLIAFGAMHPDYEDYEKEIERLSEAGVKGIKIHPVFHDTHLSDQRYIDILKKCAKLNMLVLTHGGFDISFPGVDLASPKESARVIDKVPDLRLIVAHMGGWGQWDMTISYLKDTPVYLDTAFCIGDIPFKPGEESLVEGKWEILAKEEFLHIIEEFGADRILFGTDSPWMDQAKNISDFLEMGLTKEQERLILGENAKKLLGIA